MAGKKLWGKLSTTKDTTSSKPSEGKAAAKDSEQPVASFPLKMAPPKPPAQPTIGSASVAQRSPDDPSAQPPRLQSPGSEPHTDETAAFAWKSRPIFISSTFRGMHDERDWLSVRAFPLLADKLRDRCHYLVTIDLRQGVETTDAADEAARELQVLKVCLNEIERSKPFFVAMLGERYGWVPSADRITAAARDAGLPESVNVAGKSVTELEILYGVLENQDQRKRSWFYFRTLDRTHMPPEVSAKFPAEKESLDPDSPFAKLTALKNRIRLTMPDRVRDYTLRYDEKTQSLTGLNELDALIAEDLWTDLNTETADRLRNAPRTWQESEARGVSDFVAERNRDYVERPAITDQMRSPTRSPRMLQMPAGGWWLPASRVAARAACLALCLMSCTRGLKPGELCFSLMQRGFSPCPDRWIVCCVDG